MEIQKREQEEKAVEPEEKESNALELSEDSGGENMSDDELEASPSNAGLDNQASRSGKRIINELSAKLPFSGGGDTARGVLGEGEYSARVRAGLAPSRSNKSKQLTKEQERLFTQVLQDSKKDFKMLLNTTEESHLGASEGEESEEESRLSQEINSQLQAQTVPQQEQRREMITYKIQKPMAVPIERIREEIKAQCAFEKSPELLKVKAIQRVMKTLTLKNEKCAAQGLHRWFRRAKERSIVLLKEEMEHQKVLQGLKYRAANIVGKVFERRALREEAKGFQIWKEVNSFEDDVSRLTMEIEKHNCSNLSTEKETIGQLLRKSIKDGKKIKSMIERFRRKKDSESVTAASLDTNEAAVSGTMA